MFTFIQYICMHTSTYERKKKLLHAKYLSNHSRDRLLIHTPYLVESLAARTPW